jgi:hypothetical protein
MKAARGFITVEDPGRGKTPARRSGVDGPLSLVEARSFRGGLLESQELSVLADGMAP